MTAILENSFFLVAMAIAIGQVVGKIGYKNFKLGSAGSLFTGIFISYLSMKLLGQEVQIEKLFLSLSLIGFISAVGLEASGIIVSAFKKYGIKSLLIGFFITGIGALTATASALFILGQKELVSGLYVGALTSSPGLANALEVVGRLPDPKLSMVGLGYAISYVPGVLAVIIFSQVMGKRHSKQGAPIQEKEMQKGQGLDCFGYFVVIGIGVLIGSISFPLFGGQHFSLGLTGGVLLSALVLGENRFVFQKKPDVKILNAIREISLNLFLAIVGLNFGYKAISSISEMGLAPLFIGVLIALFSVIFGYLVGRFVFKLDTPYLVGSVCGGMTSTPGLAAAIEAFEDDQVTAGYGASYPSALIGMILFTNLMLRILDC